VRSEASDRSSAAGSATVKAILIVANTLGILRQTAARVKRCPDKEVRSLGTERRNPQHLKPCSFGFSCGMAEGLAERVLRSAEVFRTCVEAVRLGRGAQPGMAVPLGHSGVASQFAVARLIVHLGLNGVQGRSIRTSARPSGRRSWRGARAGKQQSNQPRSLLQRQRESEERWRWAGRGSGWRRFVFPRTRGGFR